MDIWYFIVFIVIFRNTYLDKIPNHFPILFLLILMNIINILIETYNKVFKLIFPPSYLKYMCLFGILYDCFR